MIKKVNLKEKFSTFSDHYNPRIVGSLNGQHVKIAKLKGDFIMQKHDHEDELFYVVSGTLYIELKNETIKLEAGEFVVIPKGVEHKPYAAEEVSVMLFEPQSTLNTGDQVSEMTKSKLETI